MALYWDPFPQVVEPTEAVPPSSPTIVYRPPLRKHLEKQFRYLLDRGIVNEINEFIQRTELEDINYSYKKRHPPLIRVIKSGSYDAVEFIARFEGACLTVCDSHDNMPLHVAAKIGRLDILKLLLTIDPSMDPECKSITSEGTALFHAIINDYPECVHFLLEKNKNIKSMLEEDLRNYISRAAQLNTAKVLDVILTHAKQNSLGDISYVDILHRAVEKGSLNCVRYLVERNCPLTRKWEGGGNYTPLHCAASHNRPDIAELLCSKGADVDIPANSTHDTPLQIAVQKCYVGVVKVLLNYSRGLHFPRLNQMAPIDSKDENYYLLTAIDGCPYSMLGCWTEKLMKMQPWLDRHHYIRDPLPQRKFNRIIKKDQWLPHDLLPAKTSVSTKKSRKTTEKAVTEPAKGRVVTVNREIELVETLISGGADPNHKYLDGTNALHHCIEFGCEAMLRTLLNFGANPVIGIVTKPRKDKIATEYLNSLQFAIERNNTSAIKELVTSCPDLLENQLYAIRPDKSPFMKAVMIKATLSINILLYAGYWMTKQEIATVNAMPDDSKTFGIKKLVKLQEDMYEGKPTLEEFAFRKARQLLGTNLRTKLRHYVRLGRVPIGISKKLLLEVPRNWQPRQPDDGNGVKPLLRLASGEPALQEKS